MNQTTSFTWGYDGRGNHMPQLVVSVDAAGYLISASDANSTHASL
jgi:hypothetical protein